MDEGRRRFLGAAGASALVLSKNPLPPADLEIKASEHWATKEADGRKLRLSLWRKRTLNSPKGALLFVHGASSSGRPLFDLQTPGRPQSSTMDWFSRLGYDTWCLDCEGYGRSDKSRAVNDDLACGADDLAAASETILKVTGKRLALYGTGAGALRAGLFAQRYPDRVFRLALEDVVWSGKGSAAVAQYRERLPEYLGDNRTPIDRAFFQALFRRGKIEACDPAVVEAFADATLALDGSLPTGPYVDLALKLPVLDPGEIASPVLLLRPQWDGLGSPADTEQFFDRLPGADKQLAVLPGVAHAATLSRNREVVYHILDRFLSQPAPAYTG